MTVEKMNEWLRAVEYLMTSGEDWFVENDYGDSVVVSNKIGGRYQKFNRCLEFCGITNSAANAVLWLYENNKSDDEF